MSRGDKKAPEKPMTNKHGANGKKPIRSERDEAEMMMAEMPMKSPNRKRVKGK